MGCPPVRGDNSQALANGLSYIQVDSHGIKIYTTYISVDLAHHTIFCAKVGKGGIKRLAQGHNVVTSVRLEPATTGFQSKVGSFHNRILYKWLSIISNSL